MFSFFKGIVAGAAVDVVSSKAIAANLSVDPNDARLLVVPVVAALSFIGQGISEGSSFQIGFGCGVLASMAARVYTNSSNLTLEADVPTNSSFSM